MDPMLDMANRVASLPWAMHQSLEGEGAREAWKEMEREGCKMDCWFNLHVGGMERGADAFAAAVKAEALRERVRAALLEDWPVSGVERLEAAVERVCRAVEEE